MLWEMVDGALPKWAYGSWYWTKLHFPEKFSKVSILFHRHMSDHPFTEPWSR